MPKFRIIDTVAVWTDFIYEVEAENETDARRKYNDGEAEYKSFEINDNVDFLENSVVIEQA